MPRHDCRGFTAGRFRLLEMKKMDISEWIIIQRKIFGVDRFKQALGIDDELPDEDTGTYNTLAGFVMLQLGRVPKVADHFEWGGWRFEVVDMDRNRVDRLLVARVPPAAEPTRA